MRFFPFGSLNMNPVNLHEDLRLLDILEAQRSPATPGVALKSRLFQLCQEQAIIATTDQVDQAVDTYLSDTPDGIDNRLWPRPPSLAAWTTMTTHHRHFQKGRLSSAPFACQALMALIMVGGTGLSFWLGLVLASVWGAPASGVHPVAALLTCLSVGMGGSCASLFLAVFIENHRPVQKMATASEKVLRACAWVKTLGLPTDPRPTPAWVKCHLPTKSEMERWLFNPRSAAALRQLASSEVPLLKSDAAMLNQWSTQTPPTPNLALVGSWKAHVESDVGQGLPA
jgi:hypothetical protein